jgi:hypothetical protein
LTVLRSSTSEFYSLYIMHILVFKYILLASLAENFEITIEFVDNFFRNIFFLIFRGDGGGKDIVCSTHPTHRGYNSTTCSYGVRVCTHSPWTKIVAKPFICSNAQCLHARRYTSTRVHGTQQQCSIYACIRLTHAREGFMIDLVRLNPLKTPTVYVVFDGFNRFANGYPARI